MGQHSIEELLGSITHGRQPTRAPGPTPVGAPVATAPPIRQSEPVTETPSTRVDFWFDPLCPWTWLTAEWLIEVARQRPLDIRWRIMSLAVLNDGRDFPDEYIDLMRRAWRPVRVITAAEQQHGPDVVGPLFTEIATRYHHEGRSDDDAILAESLTAVDLPPELLGAADTDEWDAALRASHGEAWTWWGTMSGLR